VQCFRTNLPNGAAEKSFRLASHGLSCGIDVDAHPPVPSPSGPTFKPSCDSSGRTRARRWVLDRFADEVSDLASSPAFVVAHLVWFGVWICVNSIGRATFDRYLFNLLTLAVSLEAVVLTSFVLMAQNRK
jgi:hypothetical protein